MIKQVLIFVLLLSTSAAIADTNKGTKENPWFVGATLGANFVPDNESLDSEDSEALFKYGFDLGYQFNDWFALEGGLALSSQLTSTHCGRDNENCVRWKQDYKFQHLGLRGEIPIGRFFALSGKLGILKGTYQSQFDDESFSSFYPTFGVKFKVGDNWAFMYQLEYIRLPIGNGVKKEVMGANLMARYRF